MNNYIKVYKLKLTVDIKRENTMRINYKVQPISGKSKIEVFTKNYTIMCKDKSLYYCL